MRSVPSRDCPYRIAARSIFQPNQFTLNKQNITGTATDITVVGIDSVTVNGILTSLIQNADNTGNGICAWSVLNLPLKKGANTVVIAFSDEDGNVTKVSKAYTIK